MNDRAMQDELIRYLADAQQRAQGFGALSLAAAEAAKAEQFAHFLARRYYRDRLQRSFRYSQRLRGQTGRLAEEVADAPQFEVVLKECVLGSLETARRVGEMARAHLSGARHPGTWWAELLDYEYGYFLQAATSEPGAKAYWPARGVSAFCQQFWWALPEILERIKAGGAVGNDLRREVTLLFSRTPEGRIYVVEVESVVERVFRASDGVRTLEQIAQAAGVRAEDARQALETLAGIGAVRNPASGGQEAGGGQE